MVFTPRATASSEMSIMTTFRPATALIWAMPLPMVPAPMTPTVSTVVVALLSVIVPYSLGLVRRCSMFYTVLCCAAMTCPPPSMPQAMSHPRPIGGFPPMPPRKPAEIRRCRPGRQTSRAVFSIV